MPCQPRMVSIIGWRSMIGVTRNVQLDKIYKCESCGRSIEDISPGPNGPMHFSDETTRKNFNSQNPLAIQHATLRFTLIVSQMVQILLSEMQGPGNHSLLDSLRSKGPVDTGSFSCCFRKKRHAVRMSGQCNPRGERGSKTANKVRVAAIPIEPQRASSITRLGMIYLPVAYNFMMKITVTAYGKVDETKY
ncbi:hypothetical protein T265_15555, partial [Opisthorchis viverrini]